MSDEQLGEQKPKHAGGRPSKSIPISSAKRIANESGYDEIVIFGYDPAAGKMHVTTYGKTMAQCEDAAKAGNHLKRALGWPEELCNAKPSKARKKE